MSALISPYNYHLQFFFEGFHIEYLISQAIVLWILFDPVLLHVKQRFLRIVCHIDALTIQHLFDTNNQELEAAAVARGCCQNK